MMPLCFVKYVLQMTVITMTVITWQYQNKHRNDNLAGHYKTLSNI